MLVQATDRTANSPDAELVQLIDAAAFGTEEITADNLLEKFREDAQFNFFPAFRQKEEVTTLFKNQFTASTNRFIERAEKIVDGEFDSPGDENSYFSSPINKQYESDAAQSFHFKSQRQIDKSATAAEETGEEKLAWDLSRQQYFFTLGAAFWLTGDERCAECFTRRLDDWMRENPPGTNINWASSLEVAFRAMSWIWAFHFFKDSKHFTPELFQQALKFVYRHGEHLVKNLSAADRPNARLIGEALGLYYLGTQFQFFKTARAWRKTGAKILFEELERQILSDGTCFERSTRCQRDTADFYTHFLILQILNGDEETGKDLQIKLGEKLQSLVDFLMSATRPDGTTPIVGDGGRCLPLGGEKRDDFRAVLSTNAVLFERGDYKFVAGEFAEETLWLLGVAGEQSFKSLRAQIPVETSAAFEAGGYFIMRDGWTKANNFLLVAGGEEPGATSGGDADALAVDVAAGGRMTSMDLETYVHHESGELSDCFRSIKERSTPTIDDESPPETNGKVSRKTKTGAELNRWISEPRFDFFEGSRRGGGSDERLSATHTRSILFLKNDYWIFRDFVKASGKHDYKLNFHFGGAPAPHIESAENGNVWVVETPETKRGMRLFTFGDSGDWQRKEIPISNYHGGKVDAPLLQFASSGTGAQEFFTFLLPSETNADAPQVHETEIIGGRAFVINFRGYQDLLVFTDGEQIVRTEIFDTNFSFLWTRLGAEEILPEEFVLIGGTHFALDGREIINHPRELESATARRFDNKLNVQTPEGVFSVSLPQTHLTTYTARNQAR